MISVKAYTFTCSIFNMIYVQSIFAVFKYCMFVIHQFLVSRHATCCKCFATGDCFFNVLGKTNLLAGWESVVGVLLSPDGSLNS